MYGCLILYSTMAAATSIVIVVYLISLSIFLIKSKIKGIKIVVKKIITNKNKK